MVLITAYSAKCKKRDTIVLHVKKECGSLEKKSEVIEMTIETEFLPMRYYLCITSRLYIFISRFKDRERDRTKSWNVKTRK